MRVIVLFDLPTDTKVNRKMATNFRKFLISDGYDMVQYSVYSRLCANRDVADKHMGRLAKNAPKITTGSVRALMVTEHQYGDMFAIVGQKTSQEQNVKTEQLSFF